MLDEQLIEFLHFREYARVSASMSAAILALVILMSSKYELNRSFMIDKLYPSIFRSKSPGMATFRWSHCAREGPLI